jgi:hypothetical protein
MNHTTKYLLLFLIVVFGLVIIYDSLTKFGIFEGLENQTAAAAPDATAPDAAAPAATAPDATDPPVGQISPAAPPAAAAAAPEKKTASSTKKTPVKTFSF